MRTRYWIIAIVVVLAIAAVIDVGLITRTDDEGKRHDRFALRRGLDIQGGMRVVFELQTTDEVSEITEETINSVIRIIRKRVDALGVSEPLIQRKGSDQVVVELPGIADPELALSYIKETALLEFSYVRGLESRRNPVAKTKWELIRDEETGGEKIIFTNNLTGKEMTHEEVLESAELVVSGKDLNIDGIRADIRMGMPVVYLAFNKEGARKFGDFTRKHIDDVLPIVLDREVISVPGIRTAITDGRAEISGGFASVREAELLADQLRSGALPVPLEPIHVQAVDATLGRDVIDKSLVAGLVGLGAVMLFMLLFYRLPGLLANIALVIYALLCYAVYKLLGVTLTLPGIAGFILSIGMAVDANILIFERTREELRSGKTIHAAIDAGFDRAWPSIRDSNIATWITCIVLYSFGSGPVRGFALTLGFGVAVSMFTAITVTRTLLHLVTSMEWTQKASLFAVTRRYIEAAKTRRNVILTLGRRWIFYGISLGIMVPGLVFLGMYKLNPGIDFTGGSMLQVNFERTVATEDVRSSVRRAGIDAQVQLSEEKTAFVRFKSAEDLKIENPEQDSDESQYMNDVQIKNMLVARLQNDVAPVESSSVDSVGGTVAKELTGKAFWAIIWASGLIIIYLAIMFRQTGLLDGIKYGVCAIVAMIHDTAVLVGIFAILGFYLGWEVDALFITALLTVIGYSVHDSIVVFDRARENTARRERGETYEDIVNKSVLQTFRRSMFTSLTVLIVVVGLLSLGGLTLKEFYTALLIGFASGAYSSVFNASPLVIDWERFGRRRRGVAPKAVTDKVLVPGGGAARVTAEPKRAAEQRREAEPTRPVETAVDRPVPADGRAPGGAEPKPKPAGGGKGRIKPKGKKRKRRF